MKKNKKCKISRIPRNITVIKLLILGVTICSLIILTICSFTVRANIESNTELNTEFETELESVIKTSEISESSALTPNGNMMIVDDICEDKTGKQFITITTKNGNYFYIVIDRDNHGEQSVHFLNQVDEIDLFSLLDEETAKKYQSILTNTSQTQATLPTLPQPTTQVEKISEKENSRSISWLPTFLILLVVLTVLGFYAYTNRRKGMKEIPDQDEDYQEEDYIDQEE